MKARMKASVAIDMRSNWYENERQKSDQQRSSRHKSNGQRSNDSETTKEVLCFRLK